MCLIGFQCLPMSPSHFYNGALTLPKPFLAVKFALVLAKKDSVYFPCLLYTARTDYVTVYTTYILPFSSGLVKALL